MKCEQKPEFQPITIILETAQEAEAVWYAVRKQRNPVAEESAICTRLSNWFSNRAQFGGEQQ
jgi:hypothetical protein